MRLFRKHIKAQDLGAMLYEELRKGMASNTDLSVEGFLRSLDKDTSEVDSQYMGEIMIGLMFGAAMAIERSASTQVAGEIKEGMRQEFLRHLEEQGAGETQCAEWDEILAERFGMYSTTLENYSGFEPPWKLGRQFYWNLIGAEEHIAILIKIATLYVLTARDKSQELLNKYGPLLLTN